MPIYAYRCTTCGNAQDMLRKISDPPLTVCPACGAATFVKQVTAAGFQLKGSGWYVTDFRDDKKQGKSGDGAKGEKSPGAGESTPTTGDAAKSSDGSSAAPAAAAASTPAASPAPAAAPAPAASTKSDKGGT